MTKRKKRRSTTKVSKQRQTKKSTTIKQLLLSFLITVTLFLGLALYFFRLPQMPGYGMLSTYNDQQLVLINKQKPVKRFSVVYFKLPTTGETSIRRVIGLPGDNLYFKNDELFVNNQLIVERRLVPAIIAAQQTETYFTEDFTLQEVTNKETFTIPDNHYLVLGDNRPYANDSRHYGLVAAKDVIGVAQFD